MPGPTRRARRWVPPKPGDAQARLGLSEHGGVGADADIAAHAQLTAAAQREAVDCGDGGDGQRLDAAEHVVAVLAEGLAALLGQGAHLTDIGAGHKGLFAAAGDDQRINIRIGGNGIHQLVQIGQNLGIQSVQRLGPVDGGHGDMLLLFQQNMRHIHSSLHSVPPRQTAPRQRVRGGRAPSGRNPPHTYCIIVDR